MKVIIDNSLKTKLLPFITPSGLFSGRSLSTIVSYSGIVSIDLDHIDLVYKALLASDKILNPNLIFISPSQKGLKMFISVDQDKASMHNVYFNAISFYLYSTFGITADPACRDISRCCFLSYDPQAHYNAFGYANMNHLLHEFTPLPPKASIDPDIFSHPELPYPPSHSVTPYDSEAGTKLCHLSEVISRSERALLNAGWSHIPSGWVSPLKENRKTQNATYNKCDKYGFPVFYVFTAYAAPFSDQKGYSPVGIICLLEFNNNYKECIKSLVAQYLI